MFIYLFIPLFILIFFNIGASFRNTGEILSLAGCDRLTIAPTLLEELKNSTNIVPRKLCPTQAKGEYKLNKLNIDEKSFRYILNSDAMASEKLGEGIRGFCVDIEKLEKIIKDKMEVKMSEKK